MLASIPSFGNGAGDIVPVGEPSRGLVKDKMLTGGVQVGGCKVIWAEH